MTVTVDPKITNQEIPGYGVFFGSYESDRGHAKADLFRNGNLLQAYLSYKKGLEPEDISDHYRADLEKIAQENGLTLKVIHVAK